MARLALALLFFTVSLLLLIPPIHADTATPRKLVLVNPPTLLLRYHNGHLLSSNYTLNILWYGTFSPSQRATVTDFVRSLTHIAATSLPSVASWWSTADGYSTALAQLSLSTQLPNDHYSLGKNLTDVNIRALASKPSTSPTSITVVLTAADVAVTGFCPSRRGTHSRLRTGSRYLWVGNSAVQCPGQCAWPFHQPTYGPQGSPLVAPNGDVGVDGMIIHLATVLAGAVTNPDGKYYFQGSASAPEAVTACTGAFGKGTYPGYPGEVLVEPTDGASYNAHGLFGRKYLLPALWAQDFGVLHSGVIPLGWLDVSHLIYKYSHIFFFNK